MVRGDRFVAVVGARALPDAGAGEVGAVVRHFLGRGWGIGSGGARGADDYALRAVVAAGSGACRRSVVFLPGALPLARDGALGAFVAQGGRVVEGRGVGRDALLARSRRLAEAAAGVVAFFWGPSRGSVYTLRCAVGAGRRAAAVVAGGGAELPAFAGGCWVPCAFGSVAAFRWEPDAADTPAPAARPSALARIFAVPDGEPVESLMAHITSLTPGERLWFEHGVRAGDRVLVPYERLDDGKPAALAVDRLMRRLRCTAKAAFDLGECLLALDADAAVIAHYVAEAKCRGVATVVDELVALIADLIVVEPAPDTDALDHAEPLGDAAEQVTDAGEVARDVEEPDGEPSSLAWRVLGSLAPARVTCRYCRAWYVGDDETADLPWCPRCATPDTWEARQAPGFQALLREIHGCPSLARLAALGRALYARRLPRAQAGVKPAATDAVKKCATFLGVGLHLYAEKPIRPAGPPGGAPPAAAARHRSPLASPPALSRPPAAASRGAITPRQFDAIARIARGKGLEPGAVAAMSLRVFNRKPEALTKEEASALIKELSNMKGSAA